MRPPSNRKTKGTRTTAYHWHGVPRELIERALAKCRAQEPPISLKWKLRELLEKWVSAA